MGEISTQQAPGMLGSYEVLACVPEAFNQPGMDGMAQSARAAQWFEYHLMFGVSHFLLYTNEDMDDQFLQVFRRYLEDGVATRVHITHRVSPPYDPNVYYSTQAWFANDCLYRAKHHARLVSPTIDMDEYLRLGERQLHNGLQSPHFMAEFWGHVAGNMSKTLDEIYSFQLSRYRFELPPPGQLDIVSTRRAAGSQPNYPKYFLNPNAVDSLWCHWPTSWANGTVSAGILPEDVAFLNHYRAPITGQEEDEKKHGYTQDETLLREVPALKKALEARFSKPWQEVMVDLTPPSQIQK
ncbi:unnamed protein product [Effrenium voratum]|nr:unnamed protein product [Effrenium voratum]